MQTSRYDVRSIALCYCSIGKAIRTFLRELILGEKKRRKKQPWCRTIIDVPLATCAFLEILWPYHYFCAGFLYRKRFDAITMLILFDNNCIDKVDAWLKYFTTHITLATCHCQLTQNQRVFRQHQLILCLWIHSFD